MDTKALHKLEFDKIVDLLAEQAASSPGKEQCRRLVPSTNRFEIERLQRETAEAYTFLVTRGQPPFGGLRDIRNSVGCTEVGAVLTMEELLNIAGILYTSGQLKEYGKHVREDEEYPCLDPMFMGLSPMTSLEREIHRCIASEEEMYDNASQKLASIRKEIRITQERVRSQLQSMIHSSTYKSMLQDEVVTMRGGRYCIPVKAEFKSSVQGMVHDQSGSGSTVFIEPIAVVQLNNKATELELEEKREIQRILAMLSEQVHMSAQELMANFELMVQFDFLFAKAKLALRMNAVPPIFTDTGYIELKNARHPLLDEKKVVPITIYLGESFTSLIVTGPNTGGKTVTLKTLGLLQMMGQAGLHIPTSDQPKLAVLDQIFADIGDEQSIEQSLSTFSSHMVNIVEILQKVTPFSLVLFDELGAGTDPVEGAALANAILEDLRQRRILTVATTHYSELKVYALSTEGVENASCEFDVDTLKPTYRLLIGVPGKSNAFAISKRLGLPDTVIHKAQELLESNDVKFEEMMSDLELRRRQTEEEQQKIRLLRLEIDDLSRQTRDNQQKLEKQKEKILQKAREEARDILYKAKAEADESIRLMNKLVKQGQAVDIRALEEQRSKLRSSAAAAEEKAVGREAIHYEKVDRRQLVPGTRVKLRNMEQECIIQTAPDAKDGLMIQVGIMKMQIHVQDIARVLPEAGEVKKKKVDGKGQTAGAFGKAQTISLEVDLRGMMVEEAMGILDKYIDDAFLAGVPKVTVIHGKGTGALRKATQQFLKRHPHVKSYRLGAFGEGESGVTIVEMKSH